MPILSGDVKLLASERLLDTPDGGGRMTGHVVVDGQSNNLFPDISELDRTYGRVSLRKSYVSVLTDSTDSYYGAHAIIADAPEDPRVSVTLFTTKSWTDRRDNAKDRVERYLARGVKWPGQLLERQLTGQRAIALLLKPADALPRVGQALVLVQDEGKSSEFEQYVRVTRLTTTEREFTVADGGGTTKFTGVVVTCEISDPLRYDFIGPAPTHRDDISGAAVVRDTVVANAAVYYGIAPTVADTEVGDVRVQVPSLFGQLVPSAQSETPLVDLNAAGQTAPLLESSIGPVVYTARAQVSAGRNLYLGNACLPGSLRITGGGYELVDSAGELKSGTSVIGTVDYARGTVAFKEGTPGLPGGFQVTFRPAGAPVRVADTAAIAVGQENRGYAYTITLSPSPKPGSLVISYMAQGKWYDLRDRGDGAIRGLDSSFGAGTLDYVTGSIILTTGALPDANTAILFAWGTGVSYFNRVSMPVAAPTVQYTVEHPGITPGTVEISWTDGTRDQFATDDGHGSIAGDAAGTVSYTRGELTFRPNTLPAGGASFSIDYDWGPPQEVNFPHPLRNADGTVTVTLPQGEIRPGTVEVEFNLLIENYEAISNTPAEMQLVQRIDPIKIARDVPTLSDSGKFDNPVVGAITYATGVITIRPDTTVSIPFARYSVQQLGWTSMGRVVKPLYRNTFSHWEYKPAGAMMPFDESGYVKVRFRPSDSVNSASETIVVSQLELDLTDRYAERIVPGSIRFTLGNKVYVDRLGNLITDIDANTGAGTQAGTVDYASGRALVSNWQPGASNTVSMLSLLTELGGQPVDEVTFRVPAAPVRPGSVQIRAVPVSAGMAGSSSAQISATAQSDGTISATGMVGTVDYQTGVVRVRFGRFVSAAGKENEIWYSPDAVENSASGPIIFRPLPVLADTIRFNAVAYTYLPLSADVLGLDPVRLPLDGQVPIYRPGDVAVVHHTASAPFPNNVPAGYTLDVGRVRLSSLRVFDADKKQVPSDRYAADLDAGTVTLKTPLDLTGFVQPLRAEHRVEDMGLVSDTQINGVLTLTRPLTHDFPAHESLVSSALIIGDLQSRAHTLFSQQTWTGEWKNSRIGSNTIAQYNETVYPLAVTNRGAIEERWALILTNTNEFRVIGESVGQIAIGNTATDLAPINPETHAPYFNLKASGWGSGWAAGNVLRFNTAAANFPVWVARTVLQGPATQTNDSFQIQIRGDVDR